MNEWMGERVGGEWVNERESGRISELMDAMHTNGIILIFSGGLFFSIGIFFYLWETFKYSHAIWHLFYISGCICHYLTIVGYTIPYKI